jgi:eukaryotic-like serine/threonine-protein kinase
MPVCPKCGATVTPNDRFCGNCGNAIQASAVPPVGTYVQEGVAPAEVPALAETHAPKFVEDEEERENVSDTLDATERETEDKLHDPNVSEPEADSAIAKDDFHFQATLIASPDELPIAPGEKQQESTTSQSVASESEAKFKKSAVGGETSDVPRTERVAQQSTGGRRGSAKTLEAGTILINRYEIVRRIGGGGMGAVYFAKDRNLGDAPRAVKEMIQSQLDDAQHEKAISDFKRESMLLASLEHASIPTIYDYFYDEAAGRFYLVMKYISGGDFLARLRSAHDNRIDEKTVTDWGLQTADVLDYLHTRKPPIIYRDLKPANLMIDGTSGRVMLIDFGIARWVATQEKGVTAVGTMGYAPPELFSGKVEPRSDVYSLGATMFHLVTGADPQENPLLIFDFTKNPRPRQINPSISIEMEQILMRAVQYKPEDRFRSAAEMRDVLAEHLKKLERGQASFSVPAVAAPTTVAGDSETVAVEMVFCGFCGGRIAADDVFCAHCGARQPLAAAAASAALRQARATARLVVAGTTELDAAYPLQRESNLVGRGDPQSNIFPEVDLSRFDPNTKISRRHARIWRQGDSFLVEDLGSVNGTVINEQVKLAPLQPRVLESGDRLRLGETTLHFLIG